MIYILVLAVTLLSVQVLSAEARIDYSKEPYSALRETLGSAAV